MMKKFLNNNKGFTLMEVLASIVLISLIFIIVGAYFTNSFKTSASISKKYSAVQLAENLLDQYQAMKFTDLEAKTGKTESIDIQSILNADADFSDYDAKITVSRHSSPALSSRLLLLKIMVYQSKEGPGKQTVLEGYIRK
ncbi:type IV pilus modification PilV family protein [Bacillus infantis]|uniref:type IV pilus modification PilV family protein n=1 Tax=Bacillus infantis TaxID=324767 RepID=UPI0013EBEBCF|nr:type II secretion system protein [Bacillus infantis]